MAKHSTSEPVKSIKTLEDFIGWLDDAKHEFMAVCLMQETDMEFKEILKKRDQLHLLSFEDFLIDKRLRLTDKIARNAKVKEIIERYNHLTQQLRKLKTAEELRSFCKEYKEKLTIRSL